MIFEVVNGFAQNNFGSRLIFVLRSGKNYFAVRDVDFDKEGSEFWNKEDVNDPRNVFEPFFCVPSNSSDSKMMSRFEIERRVKLRAFE